MRKSLCTFIVMLMAMVLSLPMNAQALKVAKKAKAQTTAISPANGVKFNAAKKVKGSETKEFEKFLDATMNTKVNAFGKNANGLKGIRKSFKPAPLFKGVRKAPTRVLANGVELGGLVTYSDISGFPVGLYDIESNGTFTPIATGSDYSGTSGVLAGDFYYIHMFDTSYASWGIIFNELAIVNAETWEVVNKLDLGSSYEFGALEMAYDPTTESIYGCFYNSSLSALELGIVDFEAGYRGTICECDQYVGMAFDKNGQLFAVKKDATLVKVNKETGEETVVGNTNIPLKYLVSAEIDKKTGDMYMTSSTDEGGCLYKINTATAEAELVCDFIGGEEVQGLFIPGALAEDGAPDAVENLTANFVDASLTGTVSFTMPLNTFAGEALAGPVTYTVTVNGEAVATETAMPSASITVDVAVAEAGNYEIAVVLRNDVGESPKSKIKLYIGEDYAAPVQNVILAYEDAKMSLTWDATHSVNGGYIDMTKVTYTVTRTIAGEETTVATGLTACTFEEAFPTPEALVKVSYAVKAVYNGEESWAVESNSLVVGEGIVPPYTEGFDSADALDLFTIVDANEDGKTWSFYADNGNGTARISYNSSLDMDDWLITAPIKLEAGKNYDISFLAKAQSASYPEAIEAFVAKASDVESLLAGTKIASDDAVTNAWTKYENTFTPDADGKYYIGIHGISPADCYYLYVDDLTVSAGTVGNAPVAATAFTVTGDENGDLKATLKLTAPEVGVTGAALTAISKIEFQRDGEVIGDVADVTPGAEVTYVDENVPTAGIHTYTAIAYNEDGAGKEATASAFIGAYTAPWSEDFESLTNLAESFTIIDANNDGRVWTLYNTGGEQGKAARMQYNGSKAMDDWMITAPIKLEKGKLYEISYKAAAYGSSYPERVEAFIGTDATVEAMVTPIGEPTVIASAEYVTITETFAPQATGKYYIGIHGISDADMFYLYVDDIEVSAGSSAAVPAAPELTVVPNKNGELTATVKVKAPTKTLAGDDLEEINYIRVFRDGTQIAKIAADPGMESTTIDAVNEAGNHEYTAYADNAEGKGKVAKSTVYIGFDVPEVPTDIAMTETAPGKVKITWTAPATDVNGKPISGLTYSIIDLDTNERIVTGLTATEYEFQAVEEGEQNFVQYAVGASNETGEGDFDVTDFIVVGTPYAMPYEEGFADGGLGSIFGISTTGNASWNLFTSESFTDGIEDADGNDGFIGMKGSALYDSGKLFTGKISLVGAEAPVVEFAYMPLAADNENTLEVAVKAVGDAEWTVLLPAFAQGEAYDENETWAKKTIDLSAFAGKEIQIQWTAEVLAYTYTFIDAINVKEAIGNDLMAKAISAPVKVDANTEFNVNVTVSNLGMNSAEGYTVELYKNDAKVDEVTGEALASGAKALVQFTQTLGVTEKTATYKAVIVYDVDENEANNETETATVTVKQPNYPAVNDLTGSKTSEGNAQLTWSEPNLDDVAPEAMTEDFEGAESFAQAVEGWTFVDEDGAPAGGIQNLDIPGVTAGSSPLAWFVFDNSDDSKFNQSFAAHSGNKFMSNMFNYDGSQNSDWMISPALYGGEQTISLWARSYTTQYGAETLKVLYSTTDKELASFTEVLTVNPGAEWEEITFDVPEGAKYFAIQCYSKDNFMLFVDDVTYIPAEGPAAELALIGYNIYRDGEKINDEPVADTTFVDTEATDGEHTYVVTVVYEQGESAPSNEVTVGVTTGISEINADANANGNVYSVNGAMIRKGTESLNGLAKGVYIINGKKVVKK